MVNRKAQITHHCRVPATNAELADDDYEISLKLFIYLLIIN